MKVSKYCLTDNVKQDLVNCDIFTLCQIVWENIYNAGEIYPEIYPKCDKDWFDIFSNYINDEIYGEDYQISNEELNENKDIIVKFGKKFFKKEDNNYYNEAISSLLYSFESFEFDDCYIANPELREKVFRDAAERIYNKYCK